MTLSSFKNYLLRTTLNKVYDFTPLPDAFNGGEQSL